MLSTNFSNQILRVLFGQESSITQTKCWIGLSSSQPTAEGGNIAEPQTAYGYKRVLLGKNTAPSNGGGMPAGAWGTETYKMGTPSGGNIKNKDVIYFPEARGDWGTLNYFVLFDAETEGNMLAYGTLTTSVTPEANTVPLIRVDQLSVSVM